jgi:hypothetical protein
MSLNATFNEQKARLSVSVDISAVLHGPTALLIGLAPGVGRHPLTRSRLPGRMTLRLYGGAAEKQGGRGIW